MTRTTRPFARAAALALAATATLVAGASPLGAQANGASPRFPFPLGEALAYRVHLSIGGNVGTGQMRVEGPVQERGVEVWVLQFEMLAQRGPIRARDHTTSWLDPKRFAITRFEKIERHPLSRSREEVLIDGDAQTWRDGDGPVTPLGAVDPLDELSFLYFIRTLPLDRDTTFRVDRHFDPARNPTVIRILGTEVVETPAGIFRTRIVEMDVRDPKRYRGTGTIRINLDLDDCHVPVRVVSRMPILGVTTLTLTGWVHPPQYPGALICEG
jgi:hypothetical protein